MKRSNSTLRNKQEIVADSYKYIAAIEKNPSKINLIFLRAHYPKEGKENVN